VDYLAWLTNTHRAEQSLIPPRKEPDSKQHLQDFLVILRDRIHPEVFDQALAGEFFETYGPFDLHQLTDTLDALLSAQPPNLHISFYLNHILEKLMGNKS